MSVPDWTLYDAADREVDSAGLPLWTFTRENSCTGTGHRRSMVPEDDV
jgi:hypothetical protein